MGRSKTKLLFMQTPKELRQVWYKEDVAAFLGISLRTVGVMVNQNEIPSAKNRAGRTFDRDQIIKWFKLQQSRVS